MAASFLVVPPLLSACTGDGDGNGEPQQSVSVGIVSLPLEATAPSGAVYRLVGEFDVMGTTELSISSEDHAGETSINQGLPVGNYTVTLADGWELLRQTEDGDSPASNATLLSAQSQWFSIEDGRVTEVVYAFEVDGQPVATGGTLRLSATVQERSGSGGAGGGDGAGACGSAGGDCPSGYHAVSSGACKPVLFEDDFEDGVVSSEWSLWKMIFDESDGRLNATGQPRPGFDYGHSGNGRSAALATHVGDATWTDYRIEFDGEARPVGSFNPYGLPGDYRAFGVSFRVEDEKESWNEPESDSYNVSLFANYPPGVPGQVVLTSTHHFYRPGTGCCGEAPGSVYRTLSDTAYPYPLDGPSHYAVEVVGHNIKFWVNGDLALDYTDDFVDQAAGVEPHPFGGIMIGWGWELPGWVDNVVVTDLR